MSKIKTAILIFGDIIILYGALAATLILRYGAGYFKESFSNHLKPFSLIFLVWLLVLYLADLYKDKNLRTNPETIQLFALAIVISVVSSIILFYLFPYFFKLTPKTNLALFALIFGILDFSWRLTLVKLYISSGWRNRLLIIGDSPIIDELVDYLKNNPQIGYDVINQIKDYSGQKTGKNINQSIADYQINTIIIQPHLKKDPKFTKIFYQLLSSKIAIIDLITFYEMIFQKMPLDELEESWFIEKITIRTRPYDVIKRVADVFLSIIFGVIFLPLYLIIAILTKLSPRQGPVIYQQERIGINNKSFTLFKFGIMRADKGPLWTIKNDERLTFIGKILHRTHLNEIPQLYNILKGDISFIGPRAERRELVELYRQLPHYGIRHIIKPGLTGWAQLNYKPSASLEEAREKLQYDIYYIKNRSLVLDLLILLKTIRYLFISNR